MTKVLTLEQELALVAWYLSARTVRQKAKEMGIGHHTVYNILGRHRVRGRELPKVIIAMRTLERENESLHRDN